MSLWDDIYYDDFFDLIQVKDIHPLLYKDIGTQDKTYVFNSKVFISTFDNVWNIGIYPHYIPMTSFDINKFYSMCYAVHNKYHNAVELTHHGIKVYTHALRGEEKEAAATIISNLYHPGKDNQQWRRFTSVRDYINFIFGGDVLTLPVSIIPYYIDEKKGTAGLKSVYGKILMGEKESLSPIYVTQVPYVNFPDARKFFNEEEIDKLNNTDNVWIDNNGINVYVPQGDSSLSIAHAIRKVTSLRWIHFSDRYTIVPYEEKVDEVYTADVEKELCFSAVTQGMLNPEKYVKQYNSGVDYTSSISLTKGAFR